MNKKLFLLIILLFTVWLISACTLSPIQTTQPTQPVAANTTAPTEKPVTNPTDTQPPTEPVATQAASTGTKLPTYPPFPNSIPQDVLPAAQPLGNAVAFAWNNLGMHCYQLDYSQFLILPPYNVFWTQVIARGEDPAIITSGVSVQYNMPQVTNPVLHTNFWDYAAAYGWSLQSGVGLTGKGTAGTMDAAGDHFIAEGVPVVDVNDDGTWDPFPFFLVTVQNGSQQTVAETVNVAPASTEMSCYLCHTGDTIQAVMANILQIHDKNQGSKLVEQVQGGKPVLCNACHSDPAMGVMENHNATTSLSGAMHTYHADKLVGSQLPENICQACHPGPQTQCLRDVMSSAGITCTNCHGSMNDLGDPNRTPWVNLPTCESCHTQSLTKAQGMTIDNPNQNLTANSAELYRNRKAHGGGGIYCAACHGSPHAIYPTVTERDNQQSIRLQGKAGPIVECSVCHMDRPDEAFWHFGGGD
jgi:hypothetical protein